MSMKKRSLSRVVITLHLLGRKPYVGPQQITRLFEASRVASRLGAHVVEESQLQPDLVAGVASG
jgi:hypothetical protein